MLKLTTRTRRRKAATGVPAKPRPDFPLTPHPLGAWQKKIRGKVYRFGKWGKMVDGKMQRLPGDEWWQPALAEYDKKKDALYAGRTPREDDDGLTVNDLRERFLTAKSRALDAKEITARTYCEYKATANRLIQTFGEDRLVDDLSTEDFMTLRASMAEQWGPVRLGNEIQKVRTIFKWGYEAGLIDKPVRFGPEFKKPSARVMRVNRAKNGEKMLEAVECRKLIDTATVPLKAMVLLGLNCGLGNHDIATLPLAAIDVQRGWVDFPRSKTGIPRRCPLWPETVEALRAVIAARPQPRQEGAEDRVFLTVRGRQWLVNGIANPVSVAVRNLMQKVGIKRVGIGFYTLRHVFRTVADGSRDQIAANHIMGHADASMAAAYRERIDDIRLRAVVDHVHDWLFPAKANCGKDGDA
jgi:integrase